MKFITCSSLSPATGMNCVKPTGHYSTNSPHISADNTIWYDKAAEHVKQATPPMNDYQHDAMVAIDTALKHLTQSERRKILEKQLAELWAAPLKQATELMNSPAEDVTRSSPLVRYAPPGGVEESRPTFGWFHPGAPGDAFPAATRPVVDEEAEKGQPLLTIVERLANEYFGSDSLSDFMAAVRTEAAREEAEKGQAFERWLEALPKCISYEGGCDGDLVSMEHSDDCPMKGREPATLRDAFEAGATVRAEAARATAPAIEEIGLGDVAWGIAKRAIDEKWDNAKLGPAIAQFAIKYANERAAAPAKGGLEW